MYRNESAGGSRPRRIASGAAAATLSLVVLLAAAGRTAGDEPGRNQLAFVNSAGLQTTLSTADALDLRNPFFQDLGTNGRSCGTCHRPSQGWTVTPESIRARFDLTRGLDPIFRTNDGSNCEAADVSTFHKRRRAFSLLLTKGLIRVGLSVPDDAEFDVVEVDDPYDCNHALRDVSMYRRPLPSTNLGFLSTVMWDGRETVKGQSIRADLRQQAVDATTGHAQGAAPTPQQIEQIVAFELSLFTAQAIDIGAGSLTALGASGGPTALSKQPFCIGMNDPLNMLPAMPGACATTSGGLDPVVFTLFAPWQNARRRERAAIARGEQLFNTRTFVIDGVPGLNKDPEDPLAGPIRTATCTLCHDTPNAGNHSVSMALNIGISDLARRTPDLPLYTLQNKLTLDTVKTTDPGRAMVTGKWADIGKFKGPVLRALSARAPYFHNGAAATLEDAIDFYNTRFNIGLSAQERADLAAFLKAL
jgi:hypothetical protein